jgi:heme/copper-type cytochrome/quinol oxidase subunit 1
MGMGMRRTGSSRGLVYFGIICAVLTFILGIPEIGAVPVLIGAYAWKNEPESSLGLIALVLGLVLMIASFELYGPTLWYFLPSS